MPELIHSIAARLRQFVGNRRAAPRRYAQHEARLQFSASVLGEKIGQRDDALPSTLNGYTRDISETGLALIVPDIQIDEHYLTISNRALRVTLEFPGAPIVLEATPVRCQSLVSEGREQGASLLCVRITQMRERDRASFNRYLRKINDPVRDFAPRVIIPIQAPHPSLTEQGSCVTRGYNNG
jgi:hypothetical protein